MTVYVSPKTHTNIKVLAAQVGKSISEISEDALIKFIHEYRLKEVLEGRSKGK